MNGPTGRPFNAFHLDVAGVDSRVKQIVPAVGLRLVNEHHPIDSVGDTHQLVFAGVGGFHANAMTSKV